MTVLVAVKCIDGAIIGADSVATSAAPSKAGQIQTIRMQSHDKVEVVGDRVLVAGTGPVGLGQRFKGHVKAAWDSKQFQKSCMECAVGISTAACQDFNGSGTPRTLLEGYGFGSIVAGVFNHDIDVVEFDILALQPERKVTPIHFVSMGSGQLLADPFLAFVNRVLWKNRSPTVADGLLGVLWVLDHAVGLAPGNVGHPLQLGVLKRESGDWKARRLDDQDLAQVKEHLDAIEKRIGAYPEEIIASAESSEPPKPPNNKIGKK